METLRSRYLNKEASQALDRVWGDLSEDARNILRTRKMKPDALTAKMDAKYPPKTPRPTDYDSIAGRHQELTQDDNGELIPKGLDAGNKGIRSSLLRKGKVNSFTIGRADSGPFAGTYFTGASVDGKDIHINLPTDASSSTVLPALEARENVIKDSDIPYYNGLFTRHEHDEGRAEANNLGKDHDILRSISFAGARTGESHISRSVLDEESRNLRFMPERVRSALKDIRTNPIVSQVYSDADPKMYDLPNYGNTGTLSKDVTSKNNKLRFSALSQFSKNIRTDAPKVSEAYSKNVPDSYNVSKDIMTDHMGYFSKGRKYMNSFNKATQLPSSQLGLQEAGNKYLAARWGDNWLQDATDEIQKRNPF